MLLVHLQISLYRRLFLPVELRFVIGHFLLRKLNNESIKDAGRRYEERTINLLYGPIEWWDTSEVTSMYELFMHSKHFNKDISNWDVSKVTTMKKMFMYADRFNSPLETWDVSNVTDMDNMFCCALTFNQPLSKWNVCNVQIIHSLFNALLIVSAVNEVILDAINSFTIFA